VLRHVKHSRSQINVERDLVRVLRVVVRLNDSNWLAFPMYDVSVLYRVQVDLRNVFLEI